MCIGHSNLSICTPNEVNGKFNRLRLLLCTSKNPNYMTQSLNVQELVAGVSGGMWLWISKGISLWIERHKIKPCPRFIAKGTHRWSDGRCGAGHITPLCAIGCRNWCILITLNQQATQTLKGAFAPSGVSVECLKLITSSIHQLPGVERFMGPFQFASSVSLRCIWANSCLGACALDHIQGKSGCFNFYGDHRIFGTVNYIPCPYYTCQ